MVKLINVSGFAQTGCTAQVDVLMQYHSVEGVLKTYNEVGAINEFGAFKIPNSFGAVLLSDLLGQALPTRNDIHKTLLGQLPEQGEVTQSTKWHIYGLKVVGEKYGAPYPKFTQEAIDLLPETFEGLSILEKVDCLKPAIRHWTDGLKRYVRPEHFIDEHNTDIEPVLGLKNDPTGAHPLITSLLPDGAITSAIIRDPRDTNVDFNRFYGIGHTEESTRTQCRIYKSQIRSAIKQVRLYREVFDGKYFIIEFERLVKDEDYRNRYVHKMIGNRPKIRDRFDPEKSSQNIGMYKNYDPALVEIVEQECMDEYENFLQFMGTEGLLMK